MKHRAPLLGVLAVSLALHSSAFAAGGPALLQTSLRLDLNIWYDSGTIDGAVVLTVKNVGTDPVERVPLQLGRLMQASAVQDTAGKALAFTQDIVTYDDWPQLQVCQVYVALASPLQVGDSLSLAVHYGGTLVGYTETGMQYVRDHVDSAFTIIRTDARALPVISEPSLASLRSQPYGDFACTARITVPAGLTVATGVAESSRIPAGDQVTWVFDGAKPVPFLNVCVAPYDVLKSGGVRVYHFREDSTGARAVMSAVDRATGLLQRWFGLLPDSLRLQVIEIPDGWGSQASLTGGIIQTASAFRDAGRLKELYHELSHLWNVKDLDVPSCRWNEGLAMFLQERIDAELGGEEPLATRMTRALEHERDRITRAPDLAEVAFADYGSHDMTDYSYSTGQLMFDLLFRVMGPDAFDATLRGFLRSYNQSGATTGQFAEYLRKGAAPGAARVLEEWLLTPQWVERVKSGQSLQDMIAAYRE
jgi:hypothetical protein